jgi:hypothetical protein
MITAPECPPRKTFSYGFGGRNPLVLRLRGKGFLEFGMGGADGFANDEQKLQGGIDESCKAGSFARACRFSGNGDLARDGAR